MQLNPFGAMAKSVCIGLLIAGLAGLLMAAMAWVQVARERRIDLEDVDRRASALSYQMATRSREVLAETDQDAVLAFAPLLEGHQRLLGFAVYRSTGQLVVAARAIAKFLDVLNAPVEQVRRGRLEVIETARVHGAYVHILAMGMRDHGGLLEAIVVTLHDISYIDQRITGRLIHFAWWIVPLVLLLLIIVATGTWIAYDRPLHNLAAWMQRLRLGSGPEAPPSGLPIPQLHTESDRLAVSFRAARATGRAEARSTVQADQTWTRDRLRTYAVDCLQGGQLLVVSNREPYMHQLRDGQPQVIVPAGGLVTALDPILQACGGVWVAHGAGDADGYTADAHGRLMVPPAAARYTLRRVWLSREQEQGYYYGFANEGLWPLCHLAHERPVFRETDWAHYVQVNQRFAAAVLEEIGASDAMILVQDYHLALVPRLLKDAHPDLRVGLFWHIPWPNPEAFRICPWRTDLLHGMLGADLMGFHLQQFCNNFLDTVDRLVESRLDWDHGAVELRGHTTLVRPHPISVESWTERQVPTGAALASQIAATKAHYELDGLQLAVGVDRIDYTKGLPERLRAVARFLEKYPQYRERFAFVQLGAPSRTHLRRYRDHLTALESLADEINWQWQTSRWQPIHLLVAHHNAATVYCFLRMAAVCIVSSLHDGMNLVAKEFVAAQEAGDGVLILSEFAGAARELADALIINPYDTERFADAIHHAMTMDPQERRVRMERMRRVVEERNVYRWAANFLAELTATRACVSTVGTCSVAL